MHPQLGRPLQFGSHAQPRPLLPTEQKKPLRQIASPHAKQDPSSHCTPPRPSSSLAGGSAALTLPGEADGVGDLRTVAGAALPQAAAKRTGI